MHEWLASNQLHARRYVGTSAGAGIAYAAATGRLTSALTACKAAYAANPRLLKSLSPLTFAHETIYPNWVRSFVDEASRETLLQAHAPEIWVGIARLPRWLPTKVAVVLGALAYVVDKYWSQLVHPQLLPRLGYQMEILPIDDRQDVPSIEHLMRTAAAAPPFMAAREYAGRIGVDGGFADNAPRIAPQSATELQLVLLTRHYPDRALFFEMQGRWYFQPSKAIEVSTWDCTNKTDVDTPFEHGRADARRWLEGLCTSDNHQAFTNLPSD